MSSALRIVIVGHVDHGKSTLVARLLHETGSLPEGKVAELEAASRSRDVPFEWSFALDALQEERDQAVTIETTRVWLEWGGRRYGIVDTPGHREFVRNMLSGAAEADAAVLVIDAAEGIGEQTRRHSRLLSLLGIRDTIVVVNKMDAIEWSERRFNALRDECAALLKACELRALDFVPISARDGDNLIVRSQRMPWYRGKTIGESFAGLEAPPSLASAPLRLRVQDVYREGDRRIAVGRVESGTLAAGDTVLVASSGSRATVRSLERWNSPPRTIAEAGESIGLTFGQPIYLTRGDLLSHEAQPPILDYGFRAVCFWLAERPPEIGEQLDLRMGPTSARVTIAGIESAVDSGTLKPCPIEDIPRYGVVELRLRSNALLPLDESAVLPASSRFVLLRAGEPAAGGLITHALGSRTANLHPAAHLVTRDERARRSGHRGAVIWLTGLSASGKSTLAMALESRLFRGGAMVYVLDGDNIRAGLNSDLGFSAADRAENIRRIGEIAALFADAGVIVITAFISPTARDRALARRAAGAGFHEIYIRADLATCERRDPKGLYKRARAGELLEFTGISAPYEPPADPELILDTANCDLAQCVDKLFGYVQGVTDLSATPGLAGR